MKVIKSISEMRQWSQSVQKEGQTIGLVPTMGFLHEGHLSLIRKSVQVADKTVVSIFINPTQFAAGEDLDKYPQDFDRDLQLCEQEKADIVFAPDRNSIYRHDHQTFVINEILSPLLCGQSRPIHFRGVTTVVTKLFNIIEPDFSVFGQKDAQQSIIIANMVRDLNFKTKIFIEPIIREEDGLAMSSRNKYLSPQQRKNARVLAECVFYAKENFHHGNRNTEHLLDEIRTRIKNRPDCRLDYAEFVNASSLDKNFKKNDKILLVLAVYVGATRLIDNMLLNY